MPSAPPPRVPAGRHAQAGSALGEPLGPEPALCRRAPRGRGENPRRVLVIEDDAGLAEILGEVLKLEGYSVRVAGSGPEGLAEARALAPDVVLCDIGLPGLDGYEVARALRADATLRPASLVALSGFDAPDDVRRSREAGFDHHLTKPPDLDRLRTIIEGAAGREAGHHPPSACS